MLKTKCFIIGMVLSLSLQAKDFDCVKKRTSNWENCSFIRDVQGCHTRGRQHKRRNRDKWSRVEKKQKETLDEIKKQNEEIIKILKK